MTDQPRILALGDSHFGVRARAQQCAAAHETIAEIVRDRRPDLVVHSGDVFDALSRPDDRKLVADWITRVAETCPVVIAKGGGVHDRVDDAAIMSRLRTKHPVIVEQRAGVHDIAGVRVAALAWPETAWLAAATETSGGTLDELAREQIRHLLRGLGAQLEGHAPSLFLSHLLVDGSRVSNGQELVGLALNVGLSDLALARADAYVLGHVHLAQRWDVDGAPAFYTGSPFAKNWGETDQKSVVLLEWHAEAGRWGRFAIERISTGAPPLVHLEAAWDGSELVLAEPPQDPDADTWTEPPGLTGAEVRLRYSFPGDVREQAARAAAELADVLRDRRGAASVALEPIVEVVTRARAPEVAAARTLADQLVAYWRSVEFDPAERRSSLLAKLAELETL